MGSVLAITDTLFVIPNSSDNTKVARFSTADVPTGVTHTYVLPSNGAVAAADTLVTLGATQTLTNKTLSDATFTGIITAAAFFGDGSGLEGVSSSGIGTPLSGDDTSGLNKVYYVNQELSIGSTVTVNHPSSAVASYTHYQDLVVTDDADFIVSEGDTFIPDVLGINKNTSFLLPPKVNTSQRASLVGVESGAIIYNTSLNKLQVYVGSGAYNVANWQNLH